VPNNHLVQERTHKAVEIFLYGRVISKEPPATPVAKTCSCCKKVLVLNRFYGCSRGKYGKKSICIDCELTGRRKKRAMTSASSKSIPGGVREL
jgi:hypothetical protein